MSIYEFGILGCVPPLERETLEGAITNMIEDFDLRLGKDVIIYNAKNIAKRDLRASFVGAYFGGAANEDSEIVSDLLRTNAPIIPTIAHSENFLTHIPSFLQSINGLQRKRNDLNATELASAMLECVGLLRRQRRVFVSYRRTESRVAALQLHDLLTSRGFDVFLDTHDLRAGDPFQDVLWHRLCDSDVMVMLDTPNYFESKWTRSEIGRAMAKEIQVLRLVWPTHKPSKLTDLAETMYLEASDLKNVDGPLVPSKGAEVALAIERLRGRSIAARYMSLAGSLRAEVEKIGGSIEGVGAHRAVAIRLFDDRRIWAYPIVGIPTAELLNDVAEKALRAGQQETPVLVYDHVGIRDTWREHLIWLDENIRTVRAIKVREAAWSLAAWEG